MNQIQIGDLSPGEAVLSAEKIAKYRQPLERGEQLDPVHVYNVDGRLVVRDGNNRVRAHIEYCRANGMPTGTISCTLSTAPTPSLVTLNELRKVSRYYGQGADAFARIPVATSADYEATQATVGPQIWQDDSIRRA